MRSYGLTNAKNISSAEFSPFIFKGNVKNKRAFACHELQSLMLPTTLFICVQYHMGTEQRTKSVLSVLLREIIKPDKSLEFLFGSMFFHRQQPVLFLGKLWTASPEYAAS